MPNRAAPNVLYILADDMGYGDVSAMNPDSRIRTPSIDSLARDGMRFTDAHASSAVCTPSRYSILTGRYAWRSPLKEGVIWGYSPPLVESDRLTLPGFLREHGYRTACIGKWHLGLRWHDDAGNPTEEEERIDFSQPVTGGPLACGFDHFFGISASLDMPPYVYVEDDRVTALPNRRTSYELGTNFWREGPTGADFFHADVLPTLITRAARWIAGGAAAGGSTGDADVRGDAINDRPWFLYLPLPAPHTPILPTEAFRGRSGIGAYGDFCLQVDAAVGALLQAIEESGQAENTIVVFASDNGCAPYAGVHEMEALGHFPSYHFRGYKADIYDGGHRIPLLVRWPGVVPAGAESDQIVCLADLFATLADHLGRPLPEGAAEDSVSNLPIWRGEAGSQASSPVREAIVHHSVDGSFSIRKGRWKLELCPGSGGWSDPKPGEEPPDAPPMQLYDMDSDVGERANVYAEHPRVVTELTALLARYVRSGRSTPGEPQPYTEPRRWPQLAWLEALPE